MFKLPASLKSIAIAAGLVLTPPLWAQTLPALPQIPQSQPLASPNGPPVNFAPPDYKLGPGDVIALTVVGAPEFDRTVTVGAAGNLDLTYLQSPLSASGDTAAALGNALAEQLRKQNLLLDPQVAVAVVSPQSHAVTVGGAVNKPLVLYLTRPITALDAILQAGGPDPKIAGAVVDITSGDSTRSIPYTQMASGAAKGDNPQLDGGEHVTVLPGGEVFVVGAVKEPGAFPITATTPLTALKAIALAKGWISVSSKPNKAMIMRAGPDGTVEHIPVNLQKIADLKSPDVPLQANDIIYVPDNKTLRVGIFAATSAVSSLGYAVALILARQ